MQQEFYDRLAAPFYKDHKKERMLVKANDWITKLYYVMYPLLLVILLFARDKRILAVFLVPAVSFVLVSVFRKAFNAPRPYQIWEFDPLIKKDTLGKSFPSRHVFSVYVIAMAWLYVKPVVGVILMAVGVFLALARVIGGVHFVKDVVAGAVTGLVLGWIGFFLIFG